MPRRYPRRPPHAEGAEDPAPHRNEIKALQRTAEKEASVRRAKQMIARGEIWRPDFPGITGRY